jgi:predicted RNA polymerase sigma factor
MSKTLTDKQIDAQIPAARAAARKRMRQPWWPIDVRYDRKADHILITLRAGIVVAMPRSVIKELKNATAEQLAEVELMAEGLHWETLDVDVSVPGLLARVLGQNFVATAAGRFGGSARSEAKAAAARANGAKGGRPRKVTT